MLVFVTVGSTQFDALVDAVLSRAVLDAMRGRGYTRVVVQRGQSYVARKEEGTDADADANGCAGVQNMGADAAVHLAAETQMEVEMWAFKPTIEDDVRRADLVISHAGAGTILEVLRLGKPLVVVPNPTLLDNHQEELASALNALGHLNATSVPELAATLAAFDPTALVPFPPFDGSRFRRLVDDEMGFVSGEK